MFSLACSVAHLLACTTALATSDTTLVSEGARVRVKFDQETQVTNRHGAISYSSESVRLIGEVTVLESNSLVLVPEDADASLTIPHDDIEKIEVSLGKKWDPDRGAIVGFGTMLLVGVAAWIFTPKSCLEEADCLGGAVLLGASLGWLAALPRERWKEAELNAPPPVGLGVGKDGSVRLAFSVRL